jgi:hypothetical protein
MLICLANYQIFILYLVSLDYQSISLLPALSDLCAIQSILYHYSLFHLLKTSTARSMTVEKILLR